MEDAKPNPPLDTVFPEMEIWKGLWVSVQSRGPFSLQRWVNHRGHLGLGQKPGQALPSEVFSYPLTQVLLPKSEHGQAEANMEVEVEVLPRGLEHWCLGLRVLLAQRSHPPSVLANTQLAWCLWEGMSQVSISSQWIPESWTCSNHLCRDRAGKWSLVEPGGWCWSCERRKGYPQACLCPLPLWRQFYPELLRQFSV